MFILVFDISGTKFTGTTQATHPLQTLQHWCEVSVDWSGTLFCGMTINWDCDKQTFNISMPNYIHKHSPNIKPHPNQTIAFSHKHTSIKYGQTIQEALIDASNPLPHKTTNTSRMSWAHFQLCMYHWLYTCCPQCHCLLTSQGHKCSQTSLLPTPWLH